MDDEKACYINIDGDRMLVLPYTDDKARLNRTITPEQALKTLDMLILSWRSIRREILKEKDT